jgi:hypothetical protein
VHDGDVIKARGRERPGESLAHRTPTHHATTHRAAAHHAAPHHTSMPIMPGSFLALGLGFSLLLNWLGHHSVLCSRTEMRRRLRC